MGCPPVRRVGGEERGRGAPGEQAAGRTRGMKTVSSRTDGEGGKSKQAVAGRAAAGRAVLANSSLFGGCSEWLHHYPRAVAAKTSTRAPQLNTRAAGAGRQRRR